MSIKEQQFSDRISEQGSVRSAAKALDSISLVSRSSLSPRPVADLRSSVSSKAASWRQGNEVQASSSGYGSQLMSDLKSRRERVIDHEDMGSIFSKSMAQSCNDKVDSYDDVAHIVDITDVPPEDSYKLETSVGALPSLTTPMYPSVNDYEDFMRSKTLDNYAKVIRAKAKNLDGWYPNTLVWYRNLEYLSTSVCLLPKCIYNPRRLVFWSEVIASTMIPCGLVFGMPRANDIISRAQLPVEIATMMYNSYKSVKFSPQQVRPYKHLGAERAIDTVTLLRQRKDSSLELILGDKFNDFNAVIMKYSRSRVRRKVIRCYAKSRFYRRIMDCKCPLASLDPAVNPLLPLYGKIGTFEDNVVKACKALSSCSFCSRQLLSKTGFGTRHAEICPYACNTVMVDQETDSLCSGSYYIVPDLRQVENGFPSQDVSVVSLLSNKDYETMHSIVKFKSGLEEPILRCSGCGLMLCYSTRFTRLRVGETKLLHTNLIHLGWGKESINGWKVLRMADTLMAFVYDSLIIAPGRQVIDFLDYFGPPMFDHPFSFNWDEKQQHPHYENQYLEPWDGCFEAQLLTVVQTERGRSNYCTEMPPAKTRNKLHPDFDPLVGADTDGNQCYYVTADRPLKTKPSSVRLQRDQTPQPHQVTQPGSDSDKRSCLDVAKRAEAVGKRLAGKKKVSQVKNSSEKWDSQKLLAEYNKLRRSHDAFNSRKTLKAGAIASTFMAIAWEAVLAVYHGITMNWFAMASSIANIVKGAVVLAKEIKDAVDAHRASDADADPARDAGFNVGADSTLSLNEALRIFKTDVSYHDLSDFSNFDVFATLLDRFSESKWFYMPVDNRGIMNRPTLVVDYYLSTRHYRHCKIGTSRDESLTYWLPGEVRVGIPVYDNPSYLRPEQYNVLTQTMYKPFKITGGDRLLYTEPGLNSMTDPLSQSAVKKQLESVIGEVSYRSSSRWFQYLHRNRDMDSHVSTLVRAFNYYMALLETVSYRSERENGGAHSDNRLLTNEQPFNSDRQVTTMFWEPAVPLSEVETFCAHYRFEDMFKHLDCQSGLFPGFRNLSSSLIDYPRMLSFDAYNEENLNGMWWLTNQDGLSTGRIIYYYVENLNPREARISPIGQSWNASSRFAGAGIGVTQEEVFVIGNTDRPVREERYVWRGSYVCMFYSGAAPTHYINCPTCQQRLPFRLSPMRFNQMENGHVDITRCPRYVVSPTAVKTVLDCYITQHNLENQAKIAWNISLGMYMLSETKINFNLPTVQHVSDWLLLMLEPAPQSYTTPVLTDDTWWKFAHIKTIFTDQIYTICQCLNQAVQTVSGQRLASFNEAYNPNITDVGSFFSLLKLLTGVDVTPFAVLSGYGAEYSCFVDGVHFRKTLGQHAPEAMLGLYNSIQDTLTEHVCQDMISNASLSREGSDDITERFLSLISTDTLKSLHLICWETAEQGNPIGERGLSDYWVPRWRDLKTGRHIIYEPELVVDSNVNYNVDPRKFALRGNIPGWCAPLVNVLKSNTFRIFLMNEFCGVSTAKNKLNHPKAPMQLRIPYLKKKSTGLTSENWYYYTHIVSYDEKQRVSTYVRVCWTNTFERTKLEDKIPLPSSSTEIVVAANTGNDPANDPEGTLLFDDVVDMMNNIVEDFRHSPVATRRIAIPDLNILLDTQELSRQVKSKPILVPFEYPASEGATRTLPTPQSVVNVAPQSAPATKSPPPGSVDTEFTEATDATDEPAPFTPSDPEEAARYTSRILKDNSIARWDRVDLDKLDIGKLRGYFMKRHVMNNDMYPQTAALFEPINTPSSGNMCVFNGIAESLNAAYDHGVGFSTEKIRDLYKLIKEQPSPDFGGVALSDIGRIGKLIGCDVVVNDRTQSQHEQNMRYLYRQSRNKFEAIIRIVRQPNDSEAFHCQGLKRKAVTHLRGVVSSDYDPSAIASRNKQVLVTSDVNEDSGGTLDSPALQSESEGESPPDTEVPRHHDLPPRQFKCCPFESIDEFNKISGRPIPTIKTNKISARAEFKSNINLRHLKDIFFFVCNHRRGAFIYFFSHQPENTIENFIVGVGLWIIMTQHNPNKYIDPLVDFKMGYEEWDKTWVGRHEHIRTDMELDIVSYLQMQYLSGLIGRLPNQKVIFEQDIVPRFARPEPKKLYVDGLFSEDAADVFIRDTLRGLFSQFKKPHHISTVREWWDTAYAWVASGGAPRKYKVSGMRQATSNKRSAMMFLSLEHVLAHLELKPVQLAKVHMKPEIAKKRLIFGVDLMHYLIADYPTTIVENALPVKWFDLGLSNVEELDEVDKRFQDVVDDKLICSFDFAKFDTQHQAKHVGILFDVIMEWFVQHPFEGLDYALQCVNYVRESFFNQYIEFKGKRYRVHDGLFTGTRVTTLVNSALNYAYMALVKETFYRQGITYNVERSLHHGDDVWAVLNTEVTGEQLAHTANECGVLNNPAKQLFTRGRGEYLRCHYSKYGVHGFLARTIATLVNGNWEGKKLHNDTTELSSIMSYLGVIKRRVCITKTAIPWDCVLGAILATKGLEQYRFMINVCAKNGGIGFCKPHHKRWNGIISPEFDHRDEDIKPSRANMIDNYLRYLNNSKLPDMGYYLTEIQLFRRKLELNVISGETSLIGKMRLIKIGKIGEEIVPDKYLDFREMIDFVRTCKFTVSNPFKEMKGHIVDANGKDVYKEFLKEHGILDIDADSDQYSDGSVPELCKGVISQYCALKGIPIHSIRSIRNMPRHLSY